MAVRLVCVGKLGESYYRAAAAEYAKRISRYVPIDTVEVPDVPLGGRARKEVLRLEGERILSSLQRDAHVILADPKGKQLSSEEFAGYPERLLVMGRSSIAFVLGGTLGVSDDVRKRAADVVSFSSMTMGDQLARVVLLEQIYRAFTIIRGEKYHR